MNAVAGPQPLFTREGLVRLVALALLLGVGVWIARNTYWEEVSTPGLPTGDALTNPNYSVEHLAAALGMHTHVLVSLESLPPRNGALLLGALNVQTVTPAEITALEHWVERGGRLIMPGYVTGNSTELRRWSGIKAVPLRTPPVNVVEAQAQAGGVGIAQVVLNRKDCPPMQVSVDAAPTGETLVLCDVFVGNGFTSANTPAWALSDAAGIQLLRVTLGRGAVTVIGIPQIYANNNLFEHQHARAFLESSALLRGDDLWVLAPNRAEPLVKMLWRLGAPAIAFLLFAIACSIWRSFPRFGPLAPEPLVARRSLAEQIRANARFAWRSRSLGALHAAALRGLHEQAQRRIESYGLHAPAERIALIAARAGISSEQLEEAMRRTSNRSDDHERAAIVLLEQARRSL